MELKRLPLYGMLFLFLSVLGSSTILAQNVFVQDTFTSPDSGVVIGTANETFTVTVVTGDIPDIDYIEVYVYPYGAPGSATLLTTLGADDASGGDFAGFPNQTFTASGTDLIAAVAPGADSLYTIQALAFDVADVQTGETYTHVYADVDAPIVNFLSINGGAAGSYEPIIGGDTLIYSVDENYLFIDPDSVQFDFTVDTISVSGTRSELLTNGILTDVTGNEYTFVVDLTHLVPSSPSPQSATLTVTDAGEGTDDATAAITINDNTAPTVDLLSIDGVSPTNDVIPNSISGYNTFVFDVRDTYLSSSVLDTLYNLDLQVDTENFTGTIPELESDGMLTVVGDTAFIFTVNVKPHSQSTISVNLDVTDAAGNTGVDNNSVDVVDFVTDSYFLMQPYPHTSFNQDLGLNIDLEPGNEANVTGALVEVSSTSDFSVIDTSYTLDDGSVFGLVNHDVPEDFVEGMYYVRATLDLDEGGEEITRTNIVFYDTTAPSITIDLLEPQEFMGTEYLVGTSAVQFNTDDADIFNIDVDVQRILLDSTTAFFNVTNMSHYPFRFDFNSRDYDGDATEELFDGTVVFRVITTDNTGNVSSPIYFPVNIDNETPDYLVSEINGVDVIASEYDEALHPPVFAGDTLEMKFKYFADDFDDAEFELDYGPFTLEGWIADNTDSVLTVEFYLPDSDTDYDNIDLTPNDDELSVTFTDVFGNGDGNYIGTPNVGHLKIYNNSTPYVYFDEDPMGALVRDTLWLDLDWDNFGLLDSAAIQYATVDGEDTTAFTTITTLSADSLDEYSTFVMPTVDYADGWYVLRTITYGYETDRFDGDMVEVQSDLDDIIDFRIDNTFDEFVTILEQADNTLHGSEDLELLATHDGDAYGTIFQGRFVHTNPMEEENLDTTWVTLDSIVTEWDEGVFRLTMDEDDLEAFFSIVNVEGVFTFRAVGLDSAGIWQGISGNRDDAETVATIMVEYDDISPVGTFTINGIITEYEGGSSNESNSGVNINAWNAQNFDNFNVWDGTVSIGTHLFEEENDYNRTVFEIRRYAAREPGQIATFRSSQDQTLTTLSDVNGEFDLDMTDLDAGAVYKLVMYIFDDFGNRYEAGDLYFTPIGPRAHVTGLSDEHGELFFQASPHTQSVVLEVSTDGTTFEQVSWLDDDDFSYVAAGSYDGYKHGMLNLEDLQLPLGDLTFRLTAGEHDVWDESEIRNSTTIVINHSESSDVRAKSGPEVTQSQGIFTPATSSDIDLALYREKGALDDIRVEITPVNTDDNLTLFFLADENTFSTLNTLEYASFPRWGWYNYSEWFGITSPLEAIDGNVLGFKNDNYSIELDDDISILNGGVFYAYATTVLASGETIMTRERIVVNRIAAANGGSVSSPDGNFTLNVEENTLEKNANIFIEQDPSRLFFTHNSEAEYGQIGTAYYLNSFTNGAVRNGRRVNFEIAFDPASIPDLNESGSNIDEIEALCVGHTSVNGTEILFEDILEKEIDTDNNVVRFTMTYLPYFNARRIALVLEGAVVNNPGSIRVTNTSLPDDKIYVSGNHYLSITVSDDKVFSFENYFMLIDGSLIEYGTEDPDGLENGLKLEANDNINGLELSEGRHTVRWVIINDNGNRLDVSYDFIVDKKVPVISQNVQFVNKIEAGTKNTLSFVIQDRMAGDEPGSGVGLDDIFVDVYLVEPSQTIVYIDSAGTLITEQDIFKRYFKRYSIGDFIVGDGSTMDSLSIAFDIVFNQVLDVTGYEFIVHNGSYVFDEEDYEECEILCRSDEFDISQYDGYGVYDMAGNQGNAVSFTVGINPLVTSTESDGVVPEDFHLDQNYPNPFNPSTTIQYGVPATSDVTIKVFNMLGREVATLVNEKKAAGTYQAVFDASQLASGMYIYRIVAGSFVQTKKLMLIK